MASEPTVDDNNHCHPPNPEPSTVISEAYILTWAERLDSAYQRLHEQKERSICHKHEITFVESLANASQRITKI